MTLLTDHLPLISGAPNGIKKLRELILELAVRGKLVPQDPEDEPATELLRRIAEEKARLVAEGKIKKAKAVESEIAEVSYPIPSTWNAAQLGQVVEIVRGITFPASEKSKERESGRVACLRTSNVQNEIEWNDLLYIRDSFVTRPDQYVQPRDIVMSMANSRELVGKVALVGPTLDQTTTFGGFLGVIRPILIEPSFVMALLRTPHARSALIDSASQTTNIANVSLAKLRPLPFAIPPLAEQRRIVAKVDEMMALCDALEAQQTNAEIAHAKLVQSLLDSLTQARDADDFADSWQRLSGHFDTLFTAEASIDALKQTVLQLAVMGKLVPQDPTDEPASELRNRIAKEKSRLVLAGEILNQKQLAGVPLEEAPFTLPKQWEWVRLPEIYYPVSVGANKLLSSEVVEAGPIPVVDQGKRFIAGYTDDESLLIRLPGPVVIFGDHTTERKYVDFDFVAGADGVKILRPVLQNEKFFWRQLTVLKLQGRGYARHFKVLNDALFALPPLKEQERIVAKVDELMSLCEQLKTRISQARALNQQLASTLVERAVA